MPYSFNDYGGALNDLVSYPPGYDPRTGTYGHNFLQEGMNQSVTPQQYVGPQLTGPGGSGSFQSLLPNITGQIRGQQQQNPLGIFMELLRQLQGMKPPGMSQGGQMGGGMPSPDKILQAIGPILDKLGPFLKGLQTTQPNQPLRIDQNVSQMPATINY